MNIYYPTILKSLENFALVVLDIQTLVENSRELHLLFSHRIKILIYHVMLKAKKNSNLKNLS